MQAAEDAAGDLMRWPSPIIETTQPAELHEDVWHCPVVFCFILWDRLALREAGVNSFGKAFMSFLCLASMHQVLL